MKRYNILLILAVIIGFSSCVKEDQTLNPKDSNSVLEFFNEVPDVIASSTESTYPMYEYAFPAEPGVEQPFIIRVNYAGAGVAGSDINVELEAAPDATDVYNAENNETFTQLPASLYTMTPTGTIPSGQKFIDFTVLLKTADFDFTKQYTLTLRIKSASGGAIISKNYGTMLFRVNAKNKYDGVYTLKARLAPASDRATQASSAAFTFPYNIYLITRSANSVVMYDPQYYGTYIHVFRTPSGSYSGYGSFSPVFSFDAATDQLSDVANYYVNPSNGRKAVMNPAVTTSRYDAANKTVFASLLMTQPGWQDLPIYDTLIYKGPRP